jgi:GNAT superfamily N-acetyltransferase
MKIQELLENYHGSLARDNGDVITIGDARIDINTNAQFSPRPQSVIEFLVPKELRGQGIGTQLLTKAVAKYPMLGGQVSSIASLKVFWNLGFRNPRMPEASFQDHVDRMNEYSSVFMARTNEHGVPYENT